MDTPRARQHFSHSELDKYMCDVVGHKGIHLCHILNKLLPGIKDQQMITLYQNDVEHHRHELVGGCARFSEQEIAYMQSVVYEFGDGVCILYDN